MAVNQECCDYGSEEASLRGIVGDPKCGVERRTHTKIRTPFMVVLMWRKRSCLSLSTLSFSRCHKPLASNSGKLDSSPAPRPPMVADEDRWAKDRR